MIIPVKPGAYSAVFVISETDTVATGVFAFQINDLTGATTAIGPGGPYPAGTAIWCPEGAVVVGDSMFSDLETYAKAVMAVRNRVLH